jgi:hypothetical protein
MSDSERREARSDAGPGGRLRRIEQAAERLRAWTVWRMNGAYFLCHAIDGDAPTPTQWVGIGEALTTLHSALDSPPSEARPVTPAPRDERDAAVADALVSKLHDVVHAEVTDANVRAALDAWIWKIHDVLRADAPPSPGPSEREALREAIRAALNELGVPQPGYPAPVVNAVEILSAALAAPRPAPPAEPDDLEPRLGFQLGAFPIATPKRAAPPAEGRALRFDTEEAATALAAHLEYRVMPDESWDHVARSALAWFQESVRFAPDTHAGVSIVYAPARPPAARAERGHPSPPAGDEGGRG